MNLKRTVRSTVSIGALCASLAGPTSSLLLSGAPAQGDREEPEVADGLTIADHLVATSNNNIDHTATLTNAFTTTNGSPTVTVSHTRHGKSVGNPVSFYGSTVVGGLNMDGGWAIASVLDANSYTITHTSNANADAGPTGSTVVTLPSDSDDGKIRFHCLFSHLSYDDPILHPGQEGATHLHLFYGNTLADHNSTYESLRLTGNGTCQGGPLNRTAYWMPAMIDTSLDKVRIPISVQWYYSNSRWELVNRISSVCSNPNPANRILQDGRPLACPNYAIKKIERGMRAIMGFQPSRGDYPTSYKGPRRDILAGAYTCWNSAVTVRAGGSYRYLHHRSNPSLGLSSNASCQSDGVVQVRVDSPVCWNGSHAGTDGFDHIAPTGNDGARGALCPATHPYRFMGFTVISHWKYTGGIAQLENWILSSDRHNGADFENGETFHWDMWWAWNDAVQAHFHKNIHGMFPDPASLSAVGGPYLFSTMGSGGFGASVGAADWVGGPFVRNTNSGGLSGNSDIGDCTALGLRGKCRLSAASGPLSDQLVDIPPRPKR